MKARHLTAILACTGLAGCGGPQSALDAEGAPAIALRELIIGIVGVCSLVWAMVMVALIWALLRRRQDQPQRDDLHQRRMAVAVIAATLATAIIIVGLTVASFYTTRAL